MNQSGGGVDNGSDSSSSTGTASGSDSETESSGVDNISSSLEGISVPQCQGKIEKLTNSCILNFLHALSL